MTLALWQFPIFWASLCLRIKQSCTFNKVLYLADIDVGKGTWLQEMMAQVPKS